MSFAQSVAVLVATHVRLVEVQGASLFRGFVHHAMVKHRKLVRDAMGEDMYRDKISDEIQGNRGKCYGKEARKFFG